MAWTFLFIVNMENCVKSSKIVKSNDNWRFF